MAGAAIRIVYTILCKGLESLRMLVSTMQWGWGVLEAISQDTEGWLYIMYHIQVVKDECMHVRHVMMHMVRTSKGTDSFVVKMNLLYTSVVQFHIAFSRTTLSPTSWVLVIIYVHINICTSDIFNQFLLNGYLVYFPSFASINHGTVIILTYTWHFIHMACAFHILIVPNCIP